jgi:hypothetical protein
MDELGASRPAQGSIDIAPRDLTAKSIAAPALTAARSVNRGCGDERTYDRWDTHTVPHRSAWLTRCLVASLALTGLGGRAYSTPFTGGRGPCTLVLQSEDREILQLPYTVGWKPPDKAMRMGAVGVLFTGTGWMMTVEFTVRSENANYTDSVEGQAINAGNLGFGLEVPGMYHFRLEDRVAGCVQEVTVEARPPAG